MVKAKRQKKETSILESVNTPDYTIYSKFFTNDFIRSLNLDSVEKKNILPPSRMVDIINDLCEVIYKNENDYFEEEIIDKTCISIIHIRSYITLIKNDESLTFTQYLNYCDNVLYQWMIIYDIIREFSQNSNDENIKIKHKNTPAFIKKSFTINDKNYTVGYIVVRF